MGKDKRGRVSPAQCTIHHYILLLILLLLLLLPPPLKQKVISWVDPVPFLLLSFNKATYCVSDC